MSQRVGALIVGFCFLFATVFVCMPQKAWSQPPETMRYTFYCAGYGGLLGGLIGAAIMVLGNSPSDHWDYILKGAAIGVIGGTIYGVVSSAQQTPGWLDYSSDRGLTVNYPSVKVAMLSDSAAGNKYASKRHAPEIVSYVDVFSYHY